MQLSFWENDFLDTSNSIIIIGSGIVGLSTAIELKSRFPDTSVIVLERFHPPQGASTKNAGFACFGSVTELMEDLSHMKEEEVIEIIKMRWQGINLLKQRLDSKNLEILFDGGKELFDEGEFPEQKDIDICNDLMFKATDIKDYFKIGIQDDFDSFNEKCIEMPHEGELNPMQMFNALQNIAEELGVKFLIGYRVEAIYKKEKKIELSSGLELNYFKLLICTNGFTKNIFPEQDIHPARNHVGMTSIVNNIKWKGVYHYDKGYYYFRTYNNRILLGGARNFDLNKENTDEMEFNNDIQNQLNLFLQTKLMPQESVSIDHWWTGILGIGPSKYPILKELDENCFIAVRLGGMGVAIGSFLGKKLAEMVETNINNN